MIFFSICREILKDKSVLRTLMNFELKNYTLSGKVLDIGGGKNPSYFNFLKREGEVEVINIDLRVMDIDLEKDRLPHNDATVDTLLMFNVLEHIYNHKFLVGETSRVLKSGGTLIGFVPFLINYHPDPHDYFRYTSEAINKIFSEAGFKKIEVKEVGLGPFIVNYNNLVFSVPMVIRLVMFPFYYFMDLLFLKFRPNITKRYPLGYLFIISK